MLGRDPTSEKYSQRKMWCRVGRLATVTVALVTDCYYDVCCKFPVQVLVHTSNNCHGNKNPFIPSCCDVNKFLRGYAQNTTIIIKILGRMVLYPFAMEVGEDGMMGPCSLDV